MVFHLRNIQNSEITLIPSGSFSIGREEDNFLCVAHGSVSRYHAVIYNTGQDIFLEDNGSSNGTAVRGQLVSERIQVTPGDVVYFGSMPFRLEAPSDDASTSAARADDARPPKAKLRKATDLVPLEEIGLKLKESGALPDLSGLTPGATPGTAPASNADSKPLTPQPPIESQATGRRRTGLNTGQIEELGEKLRAGAAPGSRRSQEADEQAGEGAPGVPGAKPPKSGPDSYGKSTRASGPMPATPSGHRPWMHVYGTTSAAPKATTQPMETPHPAPAAAPAADKGPSSLLVIILAVGFGFGLGVAATLLYVGF
ncbi:MAG: FHA domain-containing protein [Verrucomicrobiota bacterium]